MASSSREQYEATVVLLLEQIKELRSELKTDLTNIHQAIGEQIADLVRIQRESAAENKMICIEQTKLESRINSLENFRYVLLIAIIAGSIAGSSIAPYLPVILRAAL